MVTNEMADSAREAFFDLVGKRTGIASLPLSAKGVRDAFKAALAAALPAAREQARREALEEAAGVLEEEAADWIAAANDAESDGHPGIAADFRRWAKEASKRARRIRALIDQPKETTP